MRTRIELQVLLEECLGSRNVYYEPPESVKMKYPAIVYTKSDYYYAHADDTKYSMQKQYQIIVISKTPDDPVIEKLLQLPYVSYGRHYNGDGLSHDVLTIYF